MSDSDTTLEARSKRAISQDSIEDRLAHLKLGKTIQFDVPDRPTSYSTEQVHLDAGTLVRLYMGRIEEACLKTQRQALKAGAQAPRFHLLSRCYVSYDVTAPRLRHARVTISVMRTR